MICKKCGAKVDNNSNFCNKCGSDEIVKSKKGLYISLGIIFVILLVAIGANSIIQGKREAAETARFMEDAVASIEMMNKFESVDYGLELGDAYYMYYADDSDSYSSEFLEMVRSTPVDLQAIVHIDDCEEYENTHPNHIRRENYHLYEVMNFTSVEEIWAPLSKYMTKGLASTMVSPYYFETAEDGKLYVKTEYLSISDSTGNYYDLDTLKKGDADDNKRSITIEYYSNYEYDMTHQITFKKYDDAWKICDIEYLLDY